MRFELLFVLFVPMLAAQDAVDRKQPDPALAKLQSELRQSAATVDTAFSVRLRDQGSNFANGGNPLRGTERTTEATGSWHKDAQVLAIKSPSVELLQVGRHSIVRGSAGEWRIGSKQPSGFALSFVPDPQLLLRVLGQMELDVANRSIEEIDGRACEVIAVRLTREQIDALVFAEVFIDPNPSAKAIRAFAARQQRGIKESPSFYDLACVVDVKRRLVSRLHLRVISKQMNVAQLGQLLRAARGGKGIEEEEEEEEPEVPVVKEVDLKYEKGLPVRPREGMHVVQLEVDFHDYGKVEAPQLDAAQRTLLGR